jgi:hypothetical protein
MFDQSHVGSRQDIPLPSTTIIKPVKPSVSVSHKTFQLNVRNLFSFSPNPTHAGSILSL